LRLCASDLFSDSVLQNAIENFKYLWLGFRFSEITEGSLRVAGILSHYGCEIREVNMGGGNAQAAVFGWLKEKLMG
jgi:hypothetical protein